MLTGKRVLVTAATNAVGAPSSCGSSRTARRSRFRTRPGRRRPTWTCSWLRFAGGRAAYAFAGTGAGPSVAPDLLAAVTAELGRLDVLLINGADDGASPPDRVQDPDAMSVIRWVRQAGELMAGSGGGVIVHVHVPKAPAAPTAPTAASRTAGGGRWHLAEPPPAVAGCLRSPAGPLRVRVGRPRAGAVRKPLAGLAPAATRAGGGRG